MRTPRPVSRVSMAGLCLNMEGALLETRKTNSHPLQTKPQSNNKEHTSIKKEKNKKHNHHKQTNKQTTPPDPSQSIPKRLAPSSTPPTTPVTTVPTKPPTPEATEPTAPSSPALELARSKAAGLLRTRISTPLLETRFGRRSPVFFLGGGKWPFPVKSKTSGECRSYGREETSPRKT